ncbi:MAG: phage portal protein [Bacteroidales bacterium]|nr:phage portal protein [Candidatus Scybalousia scybalohippi]
MSENKHSFLDVVRDFGRKTAYTDVQEITLDNILKVMAIGVSVMNTNRPAIRYLYNYYKGDQPARYREKIVRPEINNRVIENHSLEVVRFKTSQTFGEPIQYTCKRKDADEKINAEIDLLNDYVDDANAQARNIELGIWQSSVGTAYKAIQHNNEWKLGLEHVPFNIYIPSPLNTTIVYSSTNGKPMLSIQCLKDINGKQYFMCYSSTMYFRVQNGKVTESGISRFGGIPIIEYPNNSEKLSDIEICVTMFDTINNMQSNRMDGIEQFVQAFMKFKNCEIDESTFLQMVQLGAISVKDVGAGLQSDVELMTAELNQSESQVAKDDVYHNMLIVEGMPDRQQNTGGDTGQAVYLRNGWDFAEQRAKIDEPFVIESEKRAVQIILNIIAKTTKDVSVTVRDFDVKITRNSTDNMLVKAQALDYLIKNKIHPLIALITCGLFSDPQKVYEMSLPYMEQLYMTEAEVQAEINKAQALLNNTPNEGVE